MNEAQKVAHKCFLAGYEAAVGKLEFPPALNEGDYPGYFWAGFLCAKNVNEKSQSDVIEPDNRDPKDWTAGWVYRYSDPEVKINWRFYDEKKK